MFRRALAHDMNLPWRCVRAQEYTVFIGVKGIPHITGRVVWRHIEVGKIEVICFHFGRAVDLKTHIPENLADFAQGLVEGMQAAALHSSTWQCYVNTLTG